MACSQALQRLERIGHKKNGECQLCTSLGLDRESTPWPKEWSRGQLLGCRHQTSEFSVDSDGLTYQITHQAAGFSQIGHDVIPLMVSENLDDFAALPESWAGELLWLPRLEAIPLANLDELPLMLQKRLSVYWRHPHFVDGKRDYFSQVVEAQIFLKSCWPSVTFSPLPGLDVFNPNIEPSLEVHSSTEPSFDCRPLDFAPQISVVIPTYQNKMRLSATIRRLFESASNIPFEILVVDDGSFDGTYELFSDWWGSENWPKELVYIRLPRQKKRQMGDHGYRAGPARNVGVHWSKGAVLLFLDSDILLPDFYLNELLEKHSQFDLIQATRCQLTKEATDRLLVELGHIDQILDCEPQAVSWTEFQNSKVPWEDRPAKWKHVSTFCLSIKRNHFLELGGFSSSFSRYGFEDTDLGFRAAQAGLRFHLSSRQVFHFKHAQARSEYFHSQRRKDQLLKDSARIFYLNHLDPAVARPIAKFIR